MVYDCRHHDVVSAPGELLARSAHWDPGGGGGVTDSLSLSTNCETTAPPIWTKDSPCFATSKFTAPSFHGCPRTAPGNQP